MNIEKIHSVCPLCNSLEAKELKKYLAHNLVKCVKCNFVFAKTVPSKEILVKHYDAYGRNDYLSPITIKRYNELLDKFENFRKTNRLLDVGCGIGYFLEIAKNRGWEVYGNEFTKEAMLICQKKGINMSFGELSEEMFPENFFDVITSFEVIEHLSFPIKDLNLMMKYLRKAGGMYITTPNFNSINRYYLKNKWNIISYPEHLSYFTKSTINKAIRRIGIKKVFLKTQGFSLTRLKISLGKSKQSIISKSSDDEKIRKILEGSFLRRFTKHCINFILNFFGVGDTIKTLYIKQ